MPAPIERARECDAARNIKSQCNRRQDISPSDTPQAIADRQHRDARMDGTTGIQRVVEIQRMTHAGIQQRCLRRRQTDPTQ